MRKLATVDVIARLREHPNADQLDIATVRGWQCVVKKGEFRVGDPCVYVEIDSVLPEKPEFEFLRPHKFRIKTQRFRGELSQGICFPLSILPQQLLNREIQSGMDVTDAMGITLYQPITPAHLAGDVVGKFPCDIPKTDCERLQNHLWMLDELAGIEWGVTEKLDGSSCSVWWRDGSLHVASRNWELKPDAKNAYWQAIGNTSLADTLKDSPLALQGELIGPGIQGNRYNLSKRTVFFFDAFDRERQRYLDFMAFRSLCDDLDVESVPMISYRDLLEPMNMMLAKASVTSTLNPRVMQEGMVWRPISEKNHPRIGRVAFKVISNSYLMNP